MSEIRGDMNRRMDSAKLWMNHAENGTAVIDSNDTNNSKDAKCPGPPAPSPELQQQQIQLENNDVCGVATKNESNNNDNDANNDSEKSIPNYRQKIDCILWRSVNSHSQVNHYHLKTSRMIYRATMEACFEMIGNKNDNTIDEEESMKSIISKRVLLHFKGETWGPLSRFTFRGWNNALMTATNTTKVRFFVPKSKHTVDLGTLTEVDEKTAMRSEFVVFPTVHTLCHSFVCFC